MANPQKEHGYTPIANKIMEHLARTRIPGEARQVLDFIHRKTYGYGKKVDHIALSQFVLGTGLKKPTVIRGRNMLISMNLIFVIKKDNEEIATYRFNKDFDTWKPLPKKITLSKMITPVIKKDNLALSLLRPTIVDNTIVDITKDNIPQSQALLSHFSKNTQDKINIYIERNRLKNKSKAISSGRKLTLITELWNSRDRCKDDNIFNYALDMAINYDAPNIGYINAIIKNKKTPRPR